MYVCMYFIFMLILYVCDDDLSIDDKYPDIEHLFDMESKSTSPLPPVYKDVIIKNISIDLEKLDIKKLRSKLKELKSRIKESSSEKIIYKNKTKLIPSRRQKELKWITWIDQLDFKNAANYMAMQKAYDLILQYIYMAKHKLKILQGNRYFSTTDTGYRIGYGYRKLNRMYRRIRDIYHMMDVNKTNFKQVDIHLQLHLKATKIHVDFLYLWWILVRVDGKYRTRVGGGNTIPEWMYYPYTVG
ncbi:hypothetical protein K1T71_005903 [Dendrolimus kikuchii]|uniref:Uncharacterized protein n=1 Tax=Dendrolimus kikuchii TaxID=765133 RepID=A0ACC1D2H2_9NEOP|nr:hypothetical protein K1T71_005903 [Dendrolimus kikuchii]